MSKPALRVTAIDRSVARRTPMTDALSRSDGVMITNVSRTGCT
jgi:hypothetical protein